MTTRRVIRRNPRRARIESWCVRLGCAAYLALVLSVVAVGLIYYPTALRDLAAAVLP